MTIRHITRQLFHRTRGPKLTCWILTAAPMLCACLEEDILSEDGEDFGEGDDGAVCAVEEEENPNEDESSAESLSALPISDCDGNGGVIDGAIVGASDTDWYFYQGNDTTWCFVEPTQGVDQSEDGIRVCAYVECLSGAPDFGCPGGTTADTSPEGRPGCCSEQGGFQIQLDCAGSVDASPVVFIRVDQPDASADTCNQYSLTYYL